MTWTHPRPEYVDNNGQWRDYGKCMVCGLDMPLQDRMKVVILSTTIRQVYAHRRHRFTDVEVRGRIVHDTRTDEEIRDLADGFRSGKLEVGWE